MTAPDVDPEKQTKRHIGPIVGISAVLIFAVIVAFVFAGGEDITAEDAQDGNEEIVDTEATPAADADGDSN